MKYLIVRGKSGGSSANGRETSWETTIETNALNAMSVDLKMSADFYWGSSEYPDSNVILHIYAYTSDDEYVDLHGISGTSLTQEYDISQYSKIRFYIKFMESMEEYNTDYGNGVVYKTNLDGILSFSR